MHIKGILKYSFEDIINANNILRHETQIKISESKNDSTKAQGLQDKIYIVMS